MNNNKAILLIHCKDKQGIVATVTDFLYRNNGSITKLDQHVDSENDVFFMRVEWDLTGQKPNMAIFVSKMTHCLYDILARDQSNEWNANISIIISNHKEVGLIADKFNIDFYHLPITKENKVEQEKRQLKLLEKYEINLVVLARYMQILTNKITNKYSNRIINIHHSFLPAFPGAKPYHSAFERGVKIIGATSHYVTEDLDEGPIIEQDVAHITHKDSIKDLIRKGKDLEKLVLSRAIRSHLQRETLVYKNKTIVFNR